MTARLKQHLGTQTNTLLLFVCLCAYVSVCALFQKHSVLGHEWNYSTNRSSVFILKKDSLDLKCFYMANALAVLQVFSSKERIFLNEKCSQLKILPLCPFGCSRIRCKFSHFCLRATAHVALSPEV